MWNMERISLTTSEEKSFENIDAGRRMLTYTISSTMSHRLRFRWAGTLMSRDVKKPDICICLTTSEEKSFENIDDGRRMLTYTISSTMSHRLRFRWAGTLMSRDVKKPDICICENKDADQLQLISTFVFATRIVQSLYFLNPKFQASSHLLWLYSPVCVGPGRKPRRPVFSQ